MDESNLRIEVSVKVRPGGSWSFTALAEDELEFSGNPHSLLAIEYGAVLGPLVNGTLKRAVDKAVRAALNDIEDAWAQIAEQVEGMVIEGDPCPWCEGEWGNHDLNPHTSCPGFYVEKYLQARDTLAKHADDE